jgi:hypothetical protein
VDGIVKTCPACDEDIEVRCDFDTLGDVVVCPGCRAVSEIDYDEVFDGEDEHGWLYLTLKEAA